MKISLLIAFIVAVGLVLASESNFATISVNNLNKAFDGAKPYSDLSSAFYSVKGLVLLKEKLSPESQIEICNFVKSKVDKSNVESIFYALSLASSVSNCGLTNADYQATLDNAASSINVPELFFYTQITQHLKLKLDAKKISKNLLDGLKKDSSILNQAYSLHIAAALSEGHKAFYDTIEDILDQADEVDKKYLQYEGGVGITSLVLEGIFELSDKIGKLPAKFDQQRLTKFVNYLSSKRHPTNIKSAYYLLRLSLKLSDNNHFVPVILNRISPVSVSSSQSNVVVSLSNILGNPIKQAQFTLEAVSAKSQSGSALLSAKKAFAAKSSDGSTFELKLIEQTQPAPGFYVVAVNAVAKPASATVNAKIFFLVDNQFEVKVTTQVALSDVNIGVGDRDQSIPKLTPLAVNEQLKEKLDADQQSKVYLNFQVKEKSKNTPIEAHQAFVRFTDIKTGREIIFLAQSGQNKQYTAEIDLNANAKNFRHNSGVYSIELFVSDPIIENPINWKLGEIKLIFADDQGQGNAALLEKSVMYSKKPEIKHLFRLPEPTPSAVVSTVFTALCLVPLGLLVVLWLGIGFNLSKLQISLWAILFHGALASIFGLYYCYWIKLNMFVTLRYLALIGGVALVSGNKLLKSLASSKEKTN